MSNVDNLIKHINSLPDFQVIGKVIAVKGLLVECSGLTKFVGIGSRCKIIAKNSKSINAEIVSIKENSAILMAFSDLDLVGNGCEVIFVAEQSLIYPDLSWLGRVINAEALPIDDKGILANGNAAYSLKNQPPPAHKRKRVGKKIDLGVKAINSFTPCCYGQRMGIFAGSGVGKSVLISMLTKYADTEIKVIGLIGERGREVQEFIEDYLGEEGLKKAVIVVATGDESALMRRQAAYVTMSISEYFRDQGKSVLCLMDSVTRFAMAQREIGLSIGEPPTTKGYTPTVFAELPRLLERAGPGVDVGSITGLFSVLVDGDDHNEPIADAVRGILDGHIVLDRNIAERGRFPAVNVLKSVSRTLPACNSDVENAILFKAKKYIALYTDMEEMIRLGAYRKGTDPDVDAAITYNPAIESFLSQRPTESVDMATSYNQLGKIVGINSE